MNRFAEKCLVLAAVCTALLLSACDSPAAEVTTEAGGPAQAEATAEPTPAVISTPGVTGPITTTTAAAPITVWMPPEIAGRTDAGFTALNNEIRAFSAQHPDLGARLELKALNGTGGMLSYLRTAHQVAPAVLPDLIALPIEMLPLAAQEGLIYPLDDAVEESLYEDLFPAPARTTRSAEQVLGYPFAVTDLTHLIYNNTIITSTLPVTWTGLSQEVNAQFLFPASGPEGALLALHFYLAAGGTLTNDAGQPALQLQPLLQTLQLLDSARASGFIALQSSNVADLDEVWQAFLSGSAGVALTSSDQYLQNRTDGPDPAAASLAGPEGAVTPLVKSWVWAISTSDPNRRALAGELLTMLVSEPFLSSWSQGSSILPSRRGALDQWPDDDPYIDFMRKELARAVPYSANATSAVLTALEDAVFDVITLSQTPRAAAEAAVAALQP